MSRFLAHPDASVWVQEINGKRSIMVEPCEGLFVPTKSWVTSYSLELIEHVLRVKGPAYLCDEIRRDEDPSCIQNSYHWGILSYRGEADFAGKRLLDFGSGSGASSVVLARMFPEAEILGVELVAEFVELAQHRVEFYGLRDRVSFEVSLDSNTLPPDIGSFDYVILSAVYEHLLPRERQVILPLLWSHLERGGMVFLNQTPYRWFPVETHTTGLPLINYMPDRLAHYFACRFSRRVSLDKSWTDLLRMGIRGGTVREITTILDRGVGRAGAELINPSRLGVEDHIDLWCQLSSTKRRPFIKKLMKYIFRGIRAMTNVTVIPSLSLGIKKVS